MLKIKNSFMTLEEFINDEYKDYVLEDNKNLNKGAIELKEAWKIILERLKLYDFIEEVEE